VDIKPAHRHVIDAKSYLEGGKLGKITAVDATMYRNTPHGKPQWFGRRGPDMNAETSSGINFLGDAPKIPLTRILSEWRFFWDYSGGKCTRNMCHQVAFWYKMLGLQIRKM